MNTIIKILVLTFFSALTFDTINFILSQKGLKDANDIDLRAKLQPEIKVDIPPSDFDEDYTPGIIVLVSMIFTSIQAFIYVRKFKSVILEFLRVYFVAPDEVNSVLPQIVESPEIPEIEWVSSNVSNMTVKSDSKALVETLDFCASNILDYSAEEKVDLSNSDKQNLVLIDSYNNEFSGIVDLSACHSEVSNIDFEPEIPPVESSDVKESSCICNIDQFEDRLQALESNLKSTESVTLQWGQRIEQAEQELTNLHRQMYSVLSKVRYTPPCGDTIDNVLQEKEACFKKFTDSIKDGNNGDQFSTSNFFVGNKTLEDEGLFKKSWSGCGKRDTLTWAAEKEEDVADWKDTLKNDVSKQIEAVRSHQLIPNESAICVIEKNKGKTRNLKSEATNCVEAKIKCDLLRKQEELTGKTLSLVQEIEAVVKRETKNECINLKTQSNTKQPTKNKILPKAPLRSRKQVYTCSDRISFLAKPAQATGPPPANKIKIR